jgi:tight adherence protein B
VRRRRRRWWKLIPALAAASLALAAPAAAGVRITSVDTSGYPEVRVTVVAPLGSARPQLDEGGVPVAGLKAANLGHAKSVVLAVDQSQSMAGRKLAAAIAGARTFVAAKGRADRVEVLSFGSRPVTLSRFSSATADASAALGGLTIDSHSGTTLWDAVVRAAAALRRERAPGHVIIVLTDGRDVSSVASLQDAIAAAHAARAAVYTIGIAGPRFAPGPLRALAARTGGVYEEAASSADLTALYAAIGRALTHTWQLSYVTAARPGNQIRLDVSVPHVGSWGRTVMLADVGVSAAPTSQPPSILSASTWQSAAAPLLLGGAVALLTLLAAGFLLSVKGGGRLSSRLAPHLGQSRRRNKTRRPHRGRSLVRRFFTATEQAFANVGQFRALQRLLTRADLPLLAAELLYLSVGVGVAVGLVAGLAGAPPLLTLGLMAGGGALPFLWVRAKARTRIKVFDNQLPDLLITIAASLKAGHSFRHAVQAVVEEGAEPAAKEFRRVLNETRLGRPMDDALREMAERIDSKNLTFVLTSVTIQRQIGGSLAGLFDMVAETVRQRQQFARKIRGLTAMGRMSAYVLIGLPILLCLALTALNPTYMEPLWHSSTGHELLAMGLTMLMVGALILKKIVSFRG